MEESATSAIRAILVSQIYDRAPIGLITTFVNSLILVTVLWGWIRPAVLLVWLMATLLLTLFRWIGVQRFHHRDPEGAADYRHWENAYLLGFGLSGCLWGLAGWILFPVGSAVHQMFLALILCGMVGGTFSTFAALPLAFPVFGIPALTPIFFRFLSFPDQIHLAMAALTAIFALLTAVSAGRNWRENRELVLLRERFSRELENRTSELEEANQRLTEELRHREAEETTLRGRLESLEIRERLAHAAADFSTVPGLARAILPEVRRMTDVDFAMLQVARNSGMEIVGHDPESLDFFPEEDQTVLGQCLCGAAAQRGEAIFSRNIHLDRQCSREECKEIGMVSVAALPLWEARRLIGLLTLGVRKERLFDKEADFLQSVSDTVAVGLRNALTVERIKLEAQRVARTA